MPRWFLNVVLVIQKYFDYYFEVWCIHILNLAAYQRCPILRNKILCIVLKMFYCEGRVLSFGINGVFCEILVQQQ